MSSAPNKRTGLQFSLGLALFYAFFFLAGYLALFVAADYLIKRSVVDREREVIGERMAEYRAWFLSGQVQGLKARFTEQSRKSDELVFVRITGPGTSLLMFSSTRGSELLDAKRLDGLPVSREVLAEMIVTPDPHTVWTVSSTALPGGYVLQAGRISTPAFAVVTTFRRAFLLVLLPVMLLAVGAGAFLSYRAMKPVRDLAATVQAILDTGKFDRRVEFTGRRGDLAELGILFNRMLDRGHGLIRAMRESLDNVAHDLRTPMARMRGTAETALAADAGPEAAREAIADCLEESEHVLTILNTLMDISEAENGVMQLNLEAVDLGRMLAQITDVYELVAEERGISIRIDMPPLLTVDADRGRLQQALANLVDNAIKYGSDGGHVHVTGAEDGGEVVLRISDDGRGIPEQDLPRIWERLFRGDQSRSERGLGLGLSFVKAMVDAHGGTIKVRSRIGEGTEFELRLPKHRTT
jgi:signal transduction histidine kinase